MEMRSYVEAGFFKVGSYKKLAEILTISPNTLSDVKKGRRGLPAHNCVQLAEIINVDPLEVIAASELVTEKKEERKAIWERVLHMRHAATIAIFVAVTGFLTPTDLQASGGVTEASNTLYYVKLNRGLKYS